MNCQLIYFPFEVCYNIGILEETENAEGTI